MPCPIAAKPFAPTGSVALDSWGHTWPVRQRLPRVWRPDYRLGHLDGLKGSRDTGPDEENREGVALSVVRKAVAGFP
jgi:hypothetical protein